jgi:hypothetical protein
MKILQYGRFDSLFSEDGYDYLYHIQYEEGYITRKELGAIKKKQFNQLKWSSINEIISISR